MRQVFFNNYPENYPAARMTRVRQLLMEWIAFNWNEGKNEIAYRFDELKKKKKIEKKLY